MGSVIDYNVSLVQLETKGMTNVRHVLSNHSPMRKMRVSGAEPEPKERGRA